jgi:hypothetical protein
MAIYKFPKNFFLLKKKRKRVTLNIETSQYASNTGGHQKGPNFKNVFLFHILSKYSCLRILEQENKEINKWTSYSSENGGTNTWTIHLFSSSFLSHSSVKQRTIPFKHEIAKEKRLKSKSPQPLFFFDTHKQQTGHKEAKVIKWIHKLHLKTIFMKNTNIPSNVHG